jgi:hypothetical protein
VYGSSQTLSSDVDVYDHALRLAGQASVSICH